MTWQDNGACANDPTVSPADFFPEGKFKKNSPEYRAHVARLKALCNVCPVRQECLNYADENFETAGVWGGLTASQRKARKLPRRWIDGKYVYLHKQAQ